MKINKLLDLIGGINPSDDDLKAIIDWCNDRLPETDRYVKTPTVTPPEVEVPQVVYQAPTPVSEPPIEFGTAVEDEPVKEKKRK